MTPRAGLHDASEFGRLLFESNPIPVSSAVIRRQALEHHELDSDLAITADWDLWLRLAARGESFICEPSAVVYYRRHPAAMTARVTTLAAEQLTVHERHGALVDEETRRRMRVRDLAGLASGLIRDGAYREARTTLALAASLAELPRRQRALRVALCLPVVRRLVGRRDPYR